MDHRRSSARARARISAAAAVAAIALLGGCSGKTRNADGYTPDTAPFADAVAPSVYVPKVKTILTGLPATEAEVAAVNENPDALKGLIDQWMTTPQFKGRMLDFFRNAFQQNNVTLGAVVSSMGTRDIYVPWEVGRELEYTLMDSFPLTAWELVQEGRPFNETITTRRYMMTTAMMATLGFLDMFEVNDQRETTDLLNVVTAQRLVFDPLAAHSDGTPITQAEAIAAFRPGRSGDWVWPIPVQNMSSECLALLRSQRGTFAAPGPNPDAGKIIPPDWSTSSTLLAVMFGDADWTSGLGTTCDTNVGGPGANTTLPFVQSGTGVDDFSDWRMVTVEAIPIWQGDSVPTPPFWDVPALRSATTLRLKTPRLGFFGTPAWIANWPTNESNQARVTANQALIGALGLSIIPAAAVAPAPVSASDSAHSTDPACAACHVVLDPLRQFFRQSWTFNYHEQRDATQVFGNAAFLLGGMNIPGRGVEDLANILANHPHFAVGWAQKLQFWANSTAAAEDDPDLQHVARLFKESHYDFKTLVREVFSSPLVTLSRATGTYRSQGVTVGIARRDQLCAALSARLQIDDICAQRGNGNNVRGAAQMIATDTYYRAAELPALPRNPELFFRASVEEVCRQVAAMVCDAGADTRYWSNSAANVSAAVADMTTRFMGIPPSDPRFAAASAILSKHYADARAAGIGTTSSLRSTFTLACTSPSSVLLGL